jgi:hypothetical protein
VGHLTVVPSGPPRRSGRWPRQGILLLLLAALACVALVTGTHAGRTAVRTLFFLPEIFPGAPVRPLTWISAPPRCEDVVLRYADVEAVADVCHPAGSQARGGLVLTLGVHPLDRHDPFLVRLTEGLARTNLTVVRPESPDLTQGRIVPREIDAFVAAFQAVQAQPHVDPGRVGLAGFSVGGSLSTVAAADPRIRDQARLVFTFGAYYDAFSVLGAITDEHIRYDGIDRAWVPHPWTVQVFAEQIVNELPAGREQEYLRSALADRDGARQEAPPALSPVGQMVRDLLFDGAAVDGQALLAALPSGTKATFTTLSPAAHVGNLRARMFVMHDVGDTLIPYTESRRLVDSLPPAVAWRYAEFRMFEHVMPRDPGALLHLVPDLVELYRLLYGVFFALTE